MENKNIIYDVIIIGGGPAGYTTALYTARSGFTTLLIEKFAAGGQMCQTMQIDNYPGFVEGIDGYTLGDKMKKTAERFGALTILTEVTKVDLLSKIKKVETGKGTFEGKTIVIATGADHRHLGLLHEEEYIGKGVGYCAACDGMFYKNKEVVVIGGGNSAAADATLLSKICKKVTLIHRRDSLRADKIYHDSLKKTENVEFMWDSVVESIDCDERVTAVNVKNVKTGEVTKLPTGGVFISIGRSPATKLFEGQVEIDKSGYIVAGENTITSVDGVFAVGDVRTKDVRQIVTATADGATSAHFIERYLASLN